MTDEAAKLEYIGCLADQMADVARALQRHELARQLSAVADLADREWLAVMTGQSASEG